MREVADGVHLITAFPRYGINCYLAGGVLVDSMTRFDGGRILKALKGRTVTAHAVTHAHPDHVGATHAVASALGIPVWASVEDRAPTEDTSLIAKRQPDALINKVFGKVMLGPGHPVERELREGDDVDGFTVLETPGHSAGHIAFFRERDRVLILGDVLNNQHPLLGFPKGLRLPLGVFTPDPERNRASARRLGELRPSVALFGHGPPLSDPGRFADFCASI